MRHVCMEVDVDDTRVYKRISGGTDVEIMEWDLGSLIAIRNHKRKRDRMTHRQFPMRLGKILLKLKSR